MIEILLEIKSKLWKMKEDFDRWNKIKKKTNTSNNIINFKEREVFYIKIGKNIGFEEDGKGEDFLRPVIVFKKFNKYIFWGIPLTSSNLNNKNGFYYYKFCLNSLENCAILSQIRLFDVRRLLNKIGVIGVQDFLNIKQKINQIIG